MQPQNNIMAELVALAEVPLKVLRTRWAETFGDDPPQSARSDYLVRVLAFQMQAAAAGGVSRALTRRLAKLATAQDEGTATPSGTRRLQLGTRLLRDWKGTTHEVEVVAGGFRHLGTMYASLSEVAREITGTRWSGPLFFGLKSDSRGIEKKVPPPTYAVDLSSKTRTAADGTSRVR